jgi:hypothetical protein
MEPALKRKKLDITEPPETLNDILDSSSHSDPDDTCFKQNQSHMKQVLKDLEESKSDASDSERSEPKENDRQHFIYTRVQSMTEGDYKQFIVCRQTKFFSKGI